MQNETPPTHSSTATARQLFLNHVGQTSEAPLCLNIVKATGCYMWDADGKAYIDLIGGISFKKGCYTGQEIVARTHYLGKVKRRTHLAHVNTETAPLAGDVLVGDGTEAVGMVVRATTAPDSGFDVLAEIRLESVAAGAIKLSSSSGATLQITPFIDAG
jgi:4-aminobutyrate aminotransferase-like enzyme